MNPFSIATLILVWFATTYITLYFSFKLLRNVSISVKVINLDSDEPADLSQRTKPPTIHLSDATIKARREALKDKLKDASLPPK